MHLVIILFLIVARWRIDGGLRLVTIIPPDLPQQHELPPLGGTRPGKGPSGGLGRPLPDARMPRPALPAEVADALYEPQAQRDSAVVRRLHAMMDSLNVIIDQDQRSRQRPVWTADVAGKVFGIDSQYIHIAGIKIPTAALALLPITLPQGNYGEQMRARQLDQMREDIMQAARRTESLQLFRQYVRELRARKDAEREAAKRQRGDTTAAKPDTARAVP